MNRSRLVALAAGIALGGQLVSAQELARYRGYTLDSSLESVISASGARPESAVTLHRRPATIQELEWRAPYVREGSGQADSVQEIAFSFFNNALYQVVVTYDSKRTEGLTNKDLIDTLSATYGTPTASAGGRRISRPSALANHTALAQWEDPQSSLTLLRDSYSPFFQLLLVSKPLIELAQGAIREATRLDALEAPGRLSAQRAKDAAEDKAALDKTRTQNRATFKP